ncbi:MAG: nicotinamide-nucleotide amidohydrolase family protein [Clostridium saudiense]|uniref:CinA family protein n=1 Tax=Clostridium saudiense TaxID=1414720 RepID=UPI00291587A0|nr:nicotinamide-nucleotide amidohydrolase family protein [Clostridium saudiense]MDU3523215.1 nicotinamide-nucleotide amidohydrolase family protein [Clostridium saudiense]
MNIQGNNESSIENIIGNILCNNNLTISTAESCTGGLVAAKLISYAGISSSFLEGAVTYSNEAKIKRLGVKKDTLEKYGAVSEETAREMAEGIAKESSSNVSIATTGIAGPGGGTKEKPVGLVYIAVHLNGKTKVDKCNFDGNRNEIRNLATNYAINMMIKELKDNNYR